ncbi:glycosyl transferase [Paractinoplanes ferrugineus]|uniref:Glycosyl transferase n=1 Tax=Paractinoplanes ferrugineus TaxID=113564 RepID=A0A919M8I4_9ACTN|nr:hypothetical protein [Actinoplanes ferrugineus]GIE10501.1 glycosyl transferase [Actinoplanes ferrugineus]
MARRIGWADTVVLLGYLLLALWILRDLWADPAGRWLHNPLDQGFFQAMMAHGERVVFHGDAPLHTTRLNAPVGVNLMANTSMLAVSIPLAPVTHLYGPAVTVAVVTTLALAGTAAAWWWLLSRHLVVSRVAAGIGGLWAGFAPGFVAHANGQPNLASGYVAPFIVWQVIRLREPGRIWRGGALLGVLVAVGVFVNEEFLLILAIALGLFTALYAVFTRPPVRAFLAGLAVAALVAGALLAYPLHVQFLGPGHYRGVPFRLDQYATPVASIAAFPRNSLAGSDAVARRLSGGSVLEDATFWGPGICLMVVVAVVLLRRSAAARALALTGLVLLVMSFGSQLRLTRTTSIGPAPLGFTLRVPLLDLVTTPRYALASTTIIGVLLALAADRVRRRGPVPAAPAARIAFWAGLAAALVPVLPLPLRTSAAPPVPPFFAQGIWRSYTQDDRSIVIVPLPAMVSGRDGMRIAALSHLDFPIPRGYFLGPADPPGDNAGTWFPKTRFTVDLLEQVRRTGLVPELTAEQHRSVLADLRYWRAGIVVVLPSAPNGAGLRRVLTQVLGPPLRVGGVTLWRMPAPVGPLRTDRQPPG